jgi:hypothetical protein
LIFAPGQVSSAIQTAPLPPAICSWEKFPGARPGRSRRCREVRASVYRLVALGHAAWVGLQEVPPPPRRRTRRLPARIAWRAACWQRMLERPARIALQPTPVVRVLASTIGAAGYHPDPTIASPCEDSRGNPHRLSVIPHGAFCCCSLSGLGRTSTPISRLSYQICTSPSAA